MGTRITAIFGDQIDDSVAGLGVVKDVTDDFTHTFKVDIDDSTINFSGNTLQVKDLGITNAKLAGSISDDKLLQDYIQTSEVDGTTIEFAGGDLNVKDLGIDTAQLADEAVTEGKIDIFNAPTVGYYMQYTSNGLEWADLEAGAVQDEDLIFHEIPTGLINSSNTTYTLADIPLDGTVQVFLNGLLQAPGSGLDYEVNPVSGQTQTIVFAKAPRTNSDLYVHYVTD